MTTVMCQNCHRNMLGHQKLRIDPPRGDVQETKSDEMILLRLHKKKKIWDFGKSIKRLKISITIYFCIIHDSLLYKRLLT